MRNRIGRTRPVRLWIPVAVLLACACARRPEAQKPSASEAEGTTPYDVEWVSATVPSRMKAGATESVAVSLRNSTNRVLPTAFALSYHWTPPDDPANPVVQDGLRTVFSRDVAPGEIYTGQLSVLAPERPGTYDLILDIVHEGVAWFGDRGGATSIHRVQVE